MRFSPNFDTVAYKTGYLGSFSKVKLMIRKQSVHLHEKKLSCFIKIKLTLVLYGQLLVDAWSEGKETNFNDIFLSRSSRPFSTHSSPAYIDYTCWNYRVSIVVPLRYACIFEVLCLDKQSYIFINFDHISSSLLFS